jgi:hypothetical protein
MQTPAGKECHYYHQDFHRGRNLQECRLIIENPESLRWRPSDCSQCKVPEILNANASHNLQLKVTVKARIFGLGRTVNVTASCLKHHAVIEDPFIGCPQCAAERPGLDVFWKALEPTDKEG